MYHPRFMGKPYLMGQKMGNIFRKANVQFPIRLDAFQSEFGRESGKLLKAYFPEAAEEIRGITDVTGYDNELFTSWMMCMGCCLYTAEDDCVEVRGCTAFSFAHAGQVYYGRDNDLPPYLGRVSKSVYYRPENKPGFILNTSSFINGEEGINRHGLAAAMTFVMPKLEEIKPGLNSVFLVRYILENCKNVEEGIETLQRLPIASSCNILLADRHGEMVVVECNPFQMQIRYPEKNKQGENFIVTVNHFTSQEMREHDASERNAYFSEIRYQTALDALQNHDYANGIEHAKNILSGKYGFMCQYDKALNFDTIWSSVFDISNLKVYRAEGNPLTTRYIEDKRF
ncbi:MAG: acyl-CoA--6-aminopenicillanic acid acyl-transferase [Chloroflexi bacterium HGW-Chloroflexi-10]|nr:MAG: acyl-CoA--6-aminopenicillanic acid acyl-transferase [Chloroflexi bacterium HGW-Chloroflexi-10]